MEASFPSGQKARHDRTLRRDIDVVVHANRVKGEVSYTTFNYWMERGDARLIYSGDRSASKMG
jgi:hypothetical protein